MTDREYYRVRAQQEDQRAARAHCAEGQRIHGELAARYRQRAGDQPALQLISA